jgi:hypothetical protein
MKCANTPIFEYSRVRCKFPGGLVIINFGSKPMLLHFFQCFSHVLLRFSCMSPCTWFCKTIATFLQIQKAFSIKRHLHYIHLFTDCGQTEWNGDYFVRVVDAGSSSTIKSNPTRLATRFIIPHVRCLGRLDGHEAVCGHAVQLFFLFCRATPW